MPQVGRDVYGFANVTPARFQLYYHIIKTVYDLQLMHVLEVGIGAGLVPHVLRFNGRNVVTADFDPHLHPDFQCDIRELPFKENSFDIVLASEILEHIPFTDLDKALLEIHRVARRYAVISVPFNQHHFSVHVNLKLMKYLYFGGRINRFLERFFPVYLYYGISRGRTDIEFDGEHYWEIGYKQYPLRKVRKVVSRCFSIQREFRVNLDPYHYVFVLRKR